MSCWLGPVVLVICKLAELPRSSNVTCESFLPRSEAPILQGSGLVVDSAGSQTLAWPDQSGEAARAWGVAVLDITASDLGSLVI